MLKDAALPERIQTEDPSFVRDTYSKALLNTDKSALDRHRRRLAKAREQQRSVSEVTLLAQRLTHTEERLDTLSDQLEHTVQLLDRILKLSAQ